MNELALKTIRCAIRTLGTLAVIGLVIWSKPYLGWEWTYQDTQAVLGIVNNYMPETVLMFGIGGGALVFYRMDSDESNDFTFAAFFKAGSPYDIYRFGYFWLLIIAGWTVFITAWRDKPLEALMVVVLGAFIAKSVADSVAGALGKPRQPDEGGTR